MTVLELFAILLPCLLVMIAMWIVVRGFLKRESDTTRMLLGKEMEQMKNQLALKGKEITLPIRLQAYERMILFCSRIELGGLILRTHSAGMKTGELKNYLVAAIEEEFNHNVTQQMYMTEELWHMILLAKSEAIGIVKQISQGIPDEAPSQTLVEQLVIYTENEPQIGYLQAQSGIKKEVALLF